MKMKFIAHDGAQFDTAEECKAHELEVMKKLLLKMKPGDIEEALDQTNRKLSDALERIGDLCSHARRAAGIYRYRHRETLGREAAKDAKPREGLS